MSIEKELNSTKILGLSINSTDQKEVLDRLSQNILKKVKTLVVTPNPEFAVYAQSHPWFADIINSADLAVPDGIGLVWASRWLKRCGKINRELPQRITGTDLMEALCEEAALHGWAVGLFGGEPGVAKAALANLTTKYPGLTGWADSGPTLVLKDNRLLPKGAVKAAIKTISSHQTDLLFVGLGMGKQEKFISDSWPSLNVRLAMGVGGAFDYFSDRVKRAPIWARRFGLEWLFRFFYQPWRWQRQLVLIKFAFLILRDD